MSKPGNNTILYVKSKQRRNMVRSSIHKSTNKRGCRQGYIKPKKQHAMARTQTNNSIPAHFGQQKTRYFEFWPQNKMSTDKQLGIVLFKQANKQ